MTTRRLGVVGAGYMGPLHAEKLVQLADGGAPVSLAGIVDIKPVRAAATARRFGVPAYERVDEILSSVDALVVAVPTVEHYSVVRAALEAGVDVLVEKPIAASVEEAERLIGSARRHDCVLQVGHLEWFNPAMDLIREQFRKPRFVEGYRIGPFPERATDIDVVRDLMIHDLDILQQLLGAEPIRVEAVGMPVVTSHVDVANARLVYPCGCVASLTASRVSASPMRMIRFFQPDGYFSADFLNQCGVVARGGEAEEGGVRSLVAHKLDVGRGDALLAQLGHFIESLETRQRPLVDGLDGVGALRTALRVHRAIERAGQVSPGDEGLASRLGWPPQNDPD